LQYSTEKRVRRRQLGLQKPCTPDCEEMPVWILTGQWRANKDSICVCILWEELTSRKVSVLCVCLYVRACECANVNASVRGACMCMCMCMCVRTILSILADMVTLSLFLICVVYGECFHCLDCNPWLFKTNADNHDMHPSIDLLLLSHEIKRTIAAWNFCFAKRVLPVAFNPSASSTACFLQKNRNDVCDCVWCVCTRMCVRMCVRRFLYACLHVCVHCVCVCRRVFVCMLNARVCMYMCVFVNVCVCMCMYTCA